MQKISGSIVRLAFLINLFLVGFFLLRLQNLPPQIPLYYSRGFGDEQIANLWMIFILPVNSIIIIAINNLILKRFFTGNVFLEKVIYYTNITIMLIFSYIFLKIIILIS